MIGIAMSPSAIVPPKAQGRIELLVSCRSPLTILNRRHPASSTPLKQIRWPRTALRTTSDRSEDHRRPDRQPMPPSQASAKRKCPPPQSIASIPTATGQPNSARVWRRICYSSNGDAAAITSATTAPVCGSSPQGDIQKTQSEKQSCRDHQND